MKLRDALNSKPRAAPPKRGPVLLDLGASIQVLDDLWVKTVRAKASIDPEVDCPAFAWARGKVVPGMTIGEFFDVVVAGIDAGETTGKSTAAQLLMFVGPLMPPAVREQMLIRCPVNQTIKIAMQHRPRAPSPLEVQHMVAALNERLMDNPAAHSRAILELTADA